MLRNWLVGLALAAVVLSFGASAYAAEPTLHEVYQAAEAGNYRQAQSMMDQVLRDHPNSAKAHFVEAQLLTKQGQLAGARSELSIAQRLEPGLPFASPRAVQELEGFLSGSPGSGQPARHALPSPAGSGFPWGMLLIGAGLVALIVFAVSRLRQRSAYTPQPAGATTYGGAAPGQSYSGGAMAPTAPAGGLGSGILGGLATGAAVGAGIVAGEALMHRVFDGHRSEAPLADSPGGLLEDSRPQYDAGGEDFGVSDASSWDDAGGGSDWT